MQNIPAAQENKLKAAYSAFNSRDIDSAISLMTEDVTWPRAFKGGFVEGPEAIREYWSSQWAEIDPRVEPVSFHAQSPNSVEVRVHQVVRDLQGKIVADDFVGHKFTFEGELIKGMELCEVPST